MSIRIVDGDLLSANVKYICHQVNCMGRMGSGVAKQIRARYPNVYREYGDFCAKNTPSLLGCVQLVPCNDGRTVVNMFSQSGYGYDKKLYTDYEAFQGCLRNIKAAVPVGSVIAMPYKIGCGLGGGDWPFINSLIENELGADYQVEYWRLT